MEDVPLLVDHFISRLSTHQGKAVDGMSSGAMRVLMSHDYPGNVRELANIVEHAFVLCPAGMIEVAHLPDRVKPSRLSPETGFTGSSLRDMEMHSILAALESNGWNRAATARELGIHKTTLFRKLKKFGIRAPSS
jgi:DNA-binding NtrC family response regulator